MAESTAGFGDTIQVTTADQAISSVTPTTVTGLSFTVTGVGVYNYEVWLAVNSAAITTGIRPQITAAGSTPTYNIWRSEVPATATTSTVAYNTANVSLGALAAPQLVVVQGLARYITAVAGTMLTVQVASEIAASAVTVLTGSYMIVRKIA